MPKQKRPRYQSDDWGQILSTYMVVDMPAEGEETMGLGRPNGVRTRGNARSARRVTKGPVWEE